VVANLIISYDRLAEGLEIVAERLDVKELRNIPRVNPSPSELTRSGLSPEHLAWIRTRFEKDREFMERYCDRLLG
jgi:hypothetical protein